MVLTKELNFVKRAVLCLYFTVLASSCATQDPCPCAAAIDDLKKELDKRCPASATPGANSAPAAQSASVPPVSGAVESPTEGPPTTGDLGRTGAASAIEEVTPTGVSSVASEAKSTIAIRRFRVAVPVLNIRTGPGTTFPVVSALVKGEIVEGLEETSDWIGIATEKYVARQHLTPLD